MPVGYPKDPAAHAAVLEANARKRAEARKSNEALEALREKLTDQAPVVGKAKRTYTQRGTKNSVMVNLSEVVKDLEDKLKSRELHVEVIEGQLDRCRDELMHTSDLLELTERRLYTVLDLAARIS